MIRTKSTANHWGSGMAKFDGDAFIGVFPHPQDPDPSRINENILQGVTGKSRVTKAAVRESYLKAGPTGASPRRGEEKFLEVDLDMALDLVAAEFTRIRNTYGNNAIYAGSYGWASAGRFHHAQSQLKRFLNANGGFISSEGNYSYNAALVLMPHILGNFRQHLKQATRWSTVAKEGRRVVMFGGIPMRNVQVSGGGVARHLIRDDLLACVDAGVRFINISPLRSDATDFLKAEWIAPRPGSDTAIMIGLAHTLLIEQLYDAGFIEKYTVGFSRVRAYIDGSIDGVVKDADWAASLSGVPADRLRQLAREMAAERTLICTAVSLQRAEFGEQPLWMTVTLAAMLGQVGLPGGGFGIGYGADASIGVADRPLRWPILAQGDNPVDDFIPVASVADMLLHPGEQYEYNGETRVYPDIKMVWWAGGNPFHHHQDLNRLRRAFAQPETIIVNELNWTATARHADIVLPVASNLERNDIGAGTQDTALIPMSQVMQPPGDAREEYQHYCELERRLDNGHAFSEGKTTNEWLQSMWDSVSLSARNNGYRVPDFEEFLRGDVLQFDDPQPEAVFLSEFRRDPLAAPLPTPSGKIELYSTVIDSFNYADCPGHAHWFAPTEWLGSSLAARYPLHLISGQPATRLHSQHDNGAYSVSHKVDGREPVMMHPSDAAARGIEEGDVVILHNERGSCLAGAVITQEVRESVVFLWTGAWYDPDFTEADHRDRHGNPNVLTHDRRTSSLSQGPAAQSALVEVQKFIGVVPPVSAFDPPVKYI